MSGRFSQMTTLNTLATRPSGDSHADGKAYFETSTNQFIVWDATDGEWIQLDSDGTGAVSYDLDQLTKTEILQITDASEGDAYYATDTEEVYVWNGSNWSVY
jgi:hypothetical protein